MKLKAQSILKNKTNNGELCHQTFKIVQDDGLSDACIITKRVLTLQTDMYVRNGYKIIRHVSSGCVVEILFGIKVSTLLELNRWIVSEYIQP